ncbi:oxygenase MpaB family protein [Patulibacter minatonensis]|uniref:oxygenase MpaB family protein n=1 Tax=Patulibacter minatonensis TaxID=298163 RepID=UPI0004BA3B97|nr:oxygenase MpaB family protein [Patulibacter minatonensis]
MATPTVPETPEAAPLGDPPATARATARPAATGPATTGDAKARRRAPRARDLTPMEDYGWFGPDSVAWRVWVYPTGMTVGFSRAVVVEELDPFLIAPVKVSSKIYQQPKVRYDRTLRYFATCLFGDSASIAKASGILTRVHARVAAPDPVSGLLSDPNNPEQQLYIHMTAWHSILYTYEVFGPGRLSAADEAQYWAECRVAAHAQTIDPETVPITRAGVREYFDRMRPRLAASEATQEAMAHLMDLGPFAPDVPRVFQPVFTVAGWMFRAAVLSTMPRYQRRLANLSQPRWVDVAIRPIMKATFALVDKSVRAKLILLSALSPNTVPVAGQVLAGIPARSSEVLSPEETYRRHEAPTPRELYAELGHDQSQVVFTPSAPVPAEVAERAAVG